MSLPNERDLMKDAAVESVFAERERLISRTRKLDILESLFDNLDEDQIDAILELSDVFMRAAHLRAQKMAQLRRITTQTKPTVV